jgi:FkbM family methyltransferase
LYKGAGAAIEHQYLLRQLDVMTCVDVGANIGQFSLLIRGLFPAAQIFAFEPLEIAAAAYRRVLGADRQAKLFQLAIAPTEETRVMHVSARHDSSSLLPITDVQKDFAPGTGAVGTEAVKLAPLDSVLTPGDIRAPALLKLDVQGFELEALKGCERLLHLFDHVYAELSFDSFYDGQALAYEVIAWLEARHFHVTGINNPSSAKDRRIVQADFLFSRDGECRRL